MSENNTRIYFKKFHFCARYDTASNWETYNPILYAGEAGVVKGGNAAGWFKIGDGETEWNDLPFLGVVDQTFNPASENAQSGIAVADAIQNASIQKTAQWMHDAESQAIGEVIVQCTSTGYGYAQGYFYRSHTEEGQTTWTRKDVQPHQSLSAYALKSELPTKTSDITNDSGFITKSVNDLVNYYLKSETYTKTEVNSLISAISSMSFEVVQTLPASDIKTDVIYLVPKSTAQSQNVYDEYIYVNNAWEKIGDTQIDLSGYATKVNGAVSGHFAGLDSNGNLTDSGKSASDFVLKTDVTIYSGGDPDNITPSDLDIYIYYDTGGRYGWQNGDILIYRENLDEWRLYGRAISDTKVTSISSSSTDAQYPSAKCVYDIVGDIESALIVLRGGGAS